MYVCVCGKTKKYKFILSLNLSDDGPTQRQKLFIWTSSIVLVFQH
jgi:hypothetical protein